MSDLSRLIDDLCAGLKDPKASDFPVFPETLSGDQSKQLPNKIDPFRSFRSFRSEIEGSAKTIELEPCNTFAPPSEIAHTSSYVGAPERPERPEREAKILVTSTPSLFPVYQEKVEESGKTGKRCEPMQAPLPDLNLAKPQRFDWWAGDLIADVGRAVVLPGQPLPISPSDVRAGVARELRVLAEVGREGPEALRDAIAITRGKIRNSPALAERQANGSACHVCEAALDDSLPEIAVLTAKRGSVLWMHAGCHGAYQVRRIMLVDRIMTEAGCGPGEWAGEAV